MLRVAILAVLASCSDRAAPPTEPATLPPTPAPKPPGGSPFERFAELAPKLGDAAPAFALADTTGATVTLAEATARGPVVLVWGSFT